MAKKATKRGLYNVAAWSTSAKRVVWYDGRAWVVPRESAASYDANESHAIAERMGPPLNPPAAAIPVTMSPAQTLTVLQAYGAAPKSTARVNPARRRRPPKRKNVATGGERPGLRYFATYDNKKKLEFNAKNDAAAVRYATGLGRQRAGAKNCTSCRAMEKKKSNPVNSRAVDRAVAALEDFSGGNVDELLAVRVPELEGRAAWKLGILAQVNYIAERDGKVFEFEHRFAEPSRPLLAVLDDGSQLLVLGGAYSVTDRGITDAEE